METCYTKKRFAQQQTNNKQRYDSTTRTRRELFALLSDKLPF